MASWSAGDASGTTSATGRRAAVLSVSGDPEEEKKRLLSLLIAGDPVVTFDNIEEPFEDLGLHLLPRSMKDLKTQCSCPDSANPCKHIAGLDYFIAAKLDLDPFLLFELRGLPRSELSRQLREMPLGRALSQALSVEELPLQAAESYFTRPLARTFPGTWAAEDFWRGALRLPERIEPATPPAVAALSIKKGGDFPGFWTRDNSFIEAMELFYEAVRKRGKTW